MSTESASDPLQWALHANLGLIDQMYERYRADPSAVDPGWRRLFEPTAGEPEVPSAPVAYSPHTSDEAWMLHRIHTLVRVFRVRGHAMAEIDPLGLQPRTLHPDLDPATYGLSAAHMDQIVPTAGLTGVWQGDRASVREIIARLHELYCGPIGVEFMHISDPTQRSWLAEKVETAKNRFQRDPEAQQHIFDRLVAAETLERFLHTKFVGTKRFSLEGGESLIPLLEVMLEQAGRCRIEEVVLGMAHRGRLNVLTNFIGKSPSHLFAEFEDIDPESVLGGGDVKYHMGYSSDRVTRAGDKIHLTLAFNPSHLEAVDPVVVGRVRAKQRRRDDLARERVMGVLIHGDAAFAGQGLVAETLNLSNLHGYRTGGTLHIIVNNQIGFTTNPKDSRSTPYCTDVAKMIQVPIFHVNGDNPEAVAHVVQLAMEYRQQFRCDVVIDMLCYRKYGHNETDEPSFTQPLLYQAIAQQPSVREHYQRSLIARGVMTAEQAAEVMARRTHELEQQLTEARRQVERPKTEAMKGVWSSYRGGMERDVADPQTGVPRAVLQELSARISTVPEGFTPHQNLARLLQQRAAMGRGERPLDWGMGEHLAFATLLSEGTLVRVSGQDSRRGTFSHRHAVLLDYKTGQEYAPLAHVPVAAGPRPNHGLFSIYDSMLSEAAVLGYEYGYSLDYPEGLIIWEAQFGDFVNGAQVILDQFISSAEDKWARLSGLTMLLPHGYEGQGPEHSSARYERFLQLCAEDNMQVVYPTTPAQVFHLLRRQVRRPLRKPLVVLSPKSLLRHPAATSTLDELAEGQFQPVMNDDKVRPEAVERVLLCTGKVYYDLLEERSKREGAPVDGHRTALVRLEQLYPLRSEALQAALARFPNARDLAFVQEEPANMGALTFLKPRLEPIARALNLVLRTVSRPESASPATGSHKAHVIEQRGLMEESFTGLPSMPRPKGRRLTAPHDAIPLPRT